MTDAIPPLLLASGPAALARLHAWLDAAFAANAVPERPAYAIRLCLEEAVMNVIMHGYGALEGPIAVELWREAAGFRARVTDSAPPFDPAAAAPQPPPSGIEDGPPGGRGLLLMRRFAAGLEYARAGGRNRLTLWFAG